MFLRGGGTFLLGLFAVALGAGILITAIFPVGALLFLVALFGIWGLVGGGLLLMVLLITTRTPTGHSYLYPVIPFNKDAFCRLLWRRPIHKDNS